MHTFLQGNPTINALVASTLTLVMVMSGYFLLEPTVSRGQGVDDTFTVRQEITGELSFITPANDVTMTPAIAGLTGGNSFGTSTVAVNTNDPQGYQMTIEFEDSVAMQQELGTSSIPNYDPVVTGTPDRDFTMAVGDAGFGYTVIADSADLDEKFRSNGTSCNQAGGTSIPGQCWYNVGLGSASSSVLIIDRTSPTPSTGATTTIVFQVGVGANPSPALPTGFYTATATLTATEN